MNKTIDLHALAQVDELANDELIDVTRIARDVGFKSPVYLARDAADRYFNSPCVDHLVEQQAAEIRECLEMLFMYIRHFPDTAELMFPIFIEEDNKIELLKAVLRIDSKGDSLVMIKLYEEV
ncbi:MAG: hypothetical protein ACE3L7_14580 [Candidatus Pristimantibacillus sp.]